MYYPFGAKTYNLGSSISSTATTILLSSFIEPVTGTPYTMALLNTDIVYGTIAPKTTSSEFISFTGITQNANGTATLTGVTRGLAKKYPFTESTAYKLPHAGQSQFIISDAPQVFNEYGALENDEVITGQWEAPDPLTAQGLVTRDYMLNLINGGTISVDSVVEAGNAGETLVAGNLIYFSETDNEWLKTDADTLATVFNVKLGIAMGAGTNGGAITNGVLTYGTYTTSGLTGGDLCYASNTAGGINSGTSGTIPRVIGLAKDATHLYFDPYFQDRLYDYAVDSVGSDSYAITMAGAYGAYYAGMSITFKAGTANTGACTINVNGLGAKDLKKEVSVALATGDILANQIITAVYDGTNFQITSPLITPSMPVVLTYVVAASPATWTKQAGLKYIKVQVQAPGGGGGGATQADAAAGGGGAGGYSEKIIAAASLGATETVTIGVTGTAGAAAGGNGGNGGTTSFGSHASATGGTGAVGASAANTAGGVAGIGSLGTINLQGGAGLSGIGNSAIAVGGNGGTSAMGGGGLGGFSADSTTDVAGANGGAYGAGGGGACSGGGGDAAGGAGGAGIVIVTEYY